jgi:hypothetical protein
MGHRVQASVSEPIRESATWEDRWKGPDQGLVAAWEAGRQRSETDPELARRAAIGELVELPWKGGIVEPLKAGWKYGSLHYVAMWRGLRGEDLDLTLGARIELTCVRTGMRVVFTDDQEILLTRA